jgi:hypothetical protein
MLYAQRWGYDGIWVVNVYALRSPYPALVSSDPAPVGPDNDRWLSWAGAQAEEQGTPLVAAWGTLARPERVAEVLRLPGFGRLSALRETKGGAPGHPLYLPADLKPEPWAVAHA